MSSASRVADALPTSPSKVDRLGVAAMIAGTLITAWSGVLVRLLDVGPFAAGAWRVNVQTVNGAVIGTLRFNVINASSEPALQTIEIN